MDNRNRVWCGLGHDVGCIKCQEPIYVPNWFDKTDLEELIDQDLTQKQFEEFMKQINDSSFPDKISGLVREELSEFVSKQ